MRSLDPRSVVACKLELEGPLFRIDCDCGSSYESPQTTISGLPIAIHVCPHCGLEQLADHATSQAIITRFLPDLDFESLHRLNVELDQLSRTWHRHERWREILDSEGADLGPPMERELVARLLTPIIVEDREAGR